MSTPSSPSSRAQHHGPDDCTYRCPNTGHEVLAFRDERHVVVPSDEYRSLLDAAELLGEAVLHVPHGTQLRRDVADAIDRLREAARQGRTSAGRPRCTQVQVAASHRRVNRQQASGPHEQQPPGASHHS